MNDARVGEIEPIGVDLPEMTQVQKVKFSAEGVLQKEKAFSPDKTLSGKALFAKAREQYPDLRVPENTFLVSLSTLVKDPTSGTNCLGRKKGYFFSKAAKKLEEKQIEALEETETPAEQKRKEEGNCFTQYS